MEAILSEIAVHGELLDAIEDLIRVERERAEFIERYEFDIEYEFTIYCLEPFDTESCGIGEFIYCYCEDNGIDSSRIFDYVSRVTA